MNAEYIFTVPVIEILFYYQLRRDLHTFLQVNLFSIKYVIICLSSCSFPWSWARPPRSRWGCGPAGGGSASAAGCTCYQRSTPEQDKHSDRHMSRLRGSTPDQIKKWSTHGQIKMIDSWTNLKKKHDQIKKIDTWKNWNDRHLNKLNWSDTWTN